MAQLNEVREVPMKAMAAPRSRLVKALDWLGDPWGYVLVLPAILLYCTFQIWPIIRGLMMAFSPFSWVVPETKGLLTFNGLENYRQLIGNQEWRHSMWVSAKFTAGLLPGNFALAFFAGVMISKVSSPKWSAFYRVVSYLPVVMPLSVAMLLWSNLYSNQYGYINHFLRTILRIRNPPNWKGDADWALLAVTIATVWKRFGHNTLLFLIGIYSINRELYEAAEIGGASEWQQFWKVTLPLLKPIIVLVLVLSAGLISGTAEVMSFFGIHVGTAYGDYGGPSQSCLTAGFWAYHAAFVRPDMRMGLAASASLIVGLISMLLSGIVFGGAYGEGLRVRCPSGIKGQDSRSRYVADRIVEN